MLFNTLIINEVSWRLYAPQSMRGPAALQFDGPDAAVTGLDAPNIRAIAMIACLAGQAARPMMTLQQQVLLGYQCISIVIWRKSQMLQDMIITTRYPSQAPVTGLCKTHLPYAPLQDASF